MEEKKKWVIPVLLIAVLVLGGFIGALAFPEKVNVPVVSEKLVTVEKQVIVPQEKLVYVNNCTDGDSEVVVDIMDFKETAWDFAFDEEFDEFKYCGGYRYKASEITCDIDDVLTYKEKRDNKWLTLIANCEYDSDDVTDRCEQDFRVVYHEEDGEDPEATVTPLNSTI